MKRVAVLGTGEMGSRIAKNLAKAGHEVVAYNRTLDKAQRLAPFGVKAVESPSAAVSGAHLIISMVTDDDASRAMWLGGISPLIELLRPDQIAIESSTVSHAWTLELARQMERRTIPFLDAPVLGTRTHADAGKLIYLVGGEVTSFETAKEVFGATSAAVHHLGPVGTAIQMKLAVNAVLASQIAMLSETIAVLRNLGMSETAISLFKGFPVTSPVMLGNMESILRDEHEPQFPIALVEKDLRYYLKMAIGGGLNLLNASNILEVYRKALPFSDQNITAVSKLFGR